VKFSFALIPNPSPRGEGSQIQSPSPAGEGFRVRAKLSSFTIDLRLLYEPDEPDIADDLSIYPLQPLSKSAANQPFSLLFKQLLNSYLFYLRRVR
jgi:hypothetical protein